MTARILIVDGVATNRILMRVKLCSAFYDVIQAECGRAALDAVRWQKPDLVLCAARLPDMEGQAFCAALRAEKNRCDTPIILTYDGTDQSQRLDALEAGADDVLSEPVDDLVLFARLRSLLRANDAESELRLREDTRRALGLADQPAQFRPSMRIGYVCLEKTHDACEELQRLRSLLPDQIDEMTPETALRGAAPPDVFIIAESTLDPGGAGLELLSRLRSNTNTRRASVIYVAHAHQKQTAAAALDLGANDLLSQGPDPEELALRLTKQISRKLTADRLLDDMQSGLRAAVTDSLTGLHNRRYALPHLNRTLERCKRKGNSFAVLLADLDHFKHVNDEYGHAVGDRVLIQVAQSLSGNMRPADLVARLGGEEFLIIMPDTTADEALKAAQSLSKVISEKEISENDGCKVQVTVSMGIAIADPNDENTAQALIDRADTALYEAKARGRNRAILGGPSTPRLQEKLASSRNTAHDIVQSLQNLPPSA